MIDFLFATLSLTDKALYADVIFTSLFYIFFLLSTRFHYQVRTCVAYVQVATPLARQELVIGSCTCARMNWKNFSPFLRDKSDDPVCALIMDIFLCTCKWARFSRAHFPNSGWYSILTQAVYVTRFDQSECVICRVIFALGKSRFQRYMW